MIDVIDIDLCSAERNTANGSVCDRNKIQQQQKHNFSLDVWFIINEMIIMCTRIITIFHALGIGDIDAVGVLCP